MLVGAKFSDQLVAVSHFPSAAVQLLVNFMILVRMVPLFTKLEKYTTVPLVALMTPLFTTGPSNRNVVPFNAVMVPELVMVPPKLNVPPQVACTLPSTSTFPESVPQPVRSAL